MDACCRDEHQKGGCRVGKKSPNTTFEGKVKEADAIAV